MTYVLKPRRRPGKRLVAQARIDAVCGRYAHVATSSKRFASDKKRELAREGRRR